MLGGPIGVMAENDSSQPGLRLVARVEYRRARPNRTQTARDRPAKTRVSNASEPRTEKASAVISDMAGQVVKQDMAIEVPVLVLCVLQPGMPVLSGETGVRARKQRGSIPRADNEILSRVASCNWGGKQQEWVLQNEA